MSAADFERCIFSNMFGPDYKGLKIKGHEFNSKEMLRNPLTGGGVQYGGQLSHCMTGRPDDQMYFEFTIDKDGKIKNDIKIKIDDGGWGELFGIAVSMVATIVGIPVSPKLASEFFMKVENLQGADWNVVGSLIAGAVAAQTAAVASLPAGQPIRQGSTGRYLDAYHHPTGGILSIDYNVVLRNNQDNNSQRWVLQPVPGAANTFHVIQRSSGRYLDAYQTNGIKDFRAVTRMRQDNDTQKWVLAAAPNGRRTLQQLSSSRFLDAYQSDDFQAVTRPQQNNDSQYWAVVMPTVAVPVA